jgi:hypothetical protein
MFYATLWIYIECVGLLISDEFIFIKMRSDKIMSVLFKYYYIWPNIFSAY